MRGMPASDIAADTSAWPWVPWSLTVATTPASSISRTHSSDWSALPPSSQVCTSMQAPFAPPRSLKAVAAASSDSAWSPREITGDSNTVMSPITSGSSASSHGPSSHRPMAS